MLARVQRNMAIIAAASVIWICSCSADQPVAAKPSLASTIKFDRARSLGFVDTETGGRLASSVTVLLNSPHVIRAQLDGGEISHYSFAMSSSPDAQVTMQGSDILLKNTQLGTYTVQVTGRNSTVCQQHFVNRTDCVLAGSKPASYDQILDVVGTISIEVVDSLNSTPEGVGEGGGLIGILIRNKDSLQGVFGNLMPGQ